MEGKMVNLDKNLRSRMVQSALVSGLLLIGSGLPIGFSKSFLILGSGAVTLRYSFPETPVSHYLWDMTANLGQSVLVPLKFPLLAALLVPLLLLADTRQHRLAKALGLLALLSLSIPLGCFALALPALTRLSLGPGVFFCLAVLILQAVAFFMWKPSQPGIKVVVGLSGSQSEQVAGSSP